MGRLHSRLKPKLTKALSLRLNKLSVTPSEQELLAASSARLRAPVHAAAGVW